MDAHAGSVTDTLANIARVAEAAIGIGRVDVEMHLSNVATLALVHEVSRKGESDRAAREPVTLFSRRPEAGLVEVRVVRARDRDVVKRYAMGALDVNDGFLGAASMWALVACLRTCVGHRLGDVPLYWDTPTRLFADCDLMSIERAAQADRGVEARTVCATVPLKRVHTARARVSVTAKDAVSALARADAADLDGK